MTVITLIKKILLWGILLTAIVLIAGVYRFLYGFGAVTTLADMSANRERALAAFGNADQSMNALLSLADDDQGYRPLFDGETLAGWHGAPGYWRVAGGEIVGESKQVLKIPQYLVSDTVADNFSIKFDFLVDGDSFANSGLFYRVEVSDMAGNPPINAYQADIDVLGFTHWAGAFYHEHGPGEGSTITFTGERVWVDPDGGRVLIKPLGVETRQSTDTLAIDDPDIAAAVRFIRENAWHGINVSDVLRKVPLSRRVLEGRFRRILGRTPHEEITRLRINRIKQLLAETDLSLSMIARRTGFEHDEYLSVAFKKAVGITPGRYRQSRQQR